MINRILRAIRLDWTVFREIATDPEAMSQAAIIVVVTALLSAIGGAVHSGRFLAAFFVQLLVAIFIGWVLWAVITYFVGVYLFKGKTDIPEMMRVLGYAAAPNLLGILGVIPCVGWIGGLVGSILALIAGVLAVREAMEFDTGKAILTVLISWVVVFVLSLIIGAIVGVGGSLLSGVSG